MNRPLQLPNLDQVWEMINDCMNDVRSNLADDMLSCPMDDLMVTRAKAAVLEDVRGRVRAMLYHGDDNG